MQLSKRVEQELLAAIAARTAESFEVRTSGGLRHFISSEGQKKGLFICVLVHDDKEFKIYMC